MLTRRHLFALRYPVSEPGAPPQKPSISRHGKRLQSILQVARHGDAWCWSALCLVCTGWDAKLGRPDLLPLKDWSEDLRRTARRVLTDLLREVGEGKVQINPVEGTQVLALRWLTEEERGYLPAGSEEALS